MISRAVIVISGDPRRDRRCAEALRVAAGVAVNRRVQISIYLHREAALILDPEFETDWIDDARSQHLPLLVEQGCPIFVLEGNHSQPRAGKGGIAPQVVTAKGLAEACAAADSILRF